VKDTNEAGHDQQDSTSFLSRSNCRHRRFDGTAGGTDPFVIVCLRHNRTADEMLLVYLAAASVATIACRAFFVASDLTETVIPSDRRAECCYRREVGLIPYQQVQIRYMESKVTPVSV
jgi:hypothetical protein